MDIVIQWDYALWEWINNGFQNRSFDLILPLLRNKYIWYPLYIFIVFYIFHNYRRKNAMILILGLIATVSLGDLLAGQFLKKTIKRTRPCNELALQEDMKTRVRCSQSYSFPSAHATNHFAIATFLILGLSLGKRMSGALLFWATAIAYAQVYVGLHYPLDVLAGAILGILVGRVIFNFFNPLSVNLTVRDP